MSASAMPFDVLVVVAHPDDESFGCGSTIAHVTAAGGTVAVSCASLGEAGEVADGFDPATVVLDTGAHLERRRRAIACHVSQNSPYEGLSPGLATDFLTTDYLIRVAPATPTPAGVRLLSDRDAEPEAVVVS